MVDLVNCTRNTKETFFEDVVLWPAFDQLHRRRVDRLRFRFPFQTESKTVDHYGGIPLGCAGCCGKCTAEHQREKAERHFVPEGEERHVVPLEMDCPDFPPELC